MCLSNYFFIMLITITGSVVGDGGHFDGKTKTTRIKTTTKMTTIKETTTETSIVIGSAMVISRSAS